MINKQLSIDASPIKAFTLAHLNSQAIGRSKGGIEVRPAKVLDLATSIVNH